MGNFYKNHIRGKEIYYVLTVIVLALIASGFFFLSPRRTFVTHNHYVQIVDSLQKSDSIKPVSGNTYYEQRLDSLASLVQRIDDQYQMDIDIMVDKSNTWLGFWLTLMSVILGIFALFNWHQVSKNSEKFDSLMKDCREKEEDVIKEKKEFEEYKVREIGKIKELAKISSLCECMISLPDPSFMAKEEDRKSQVIYLLENLQKSYSQFVSHISLESNDMKRADMVYAIVLVLTDIKIAVLNSQRIFTGLAANISFHQFLKNLSARIDTLRNSGIVSADDIQKLSSIAGEMTRLIGECK